MNREAVITGGQGDLAAVIASTLEKAGLSVARPGRDELDVSDSDSVTRYFESHQPELLICCAGLAENALLSRLSVESWERQIEVNLTGAYRCAQAVVRSMSRARRGHIIFIGSYSAEHPPAGQPAYAAAKAGLKGLAASLAQELGPRGVRTNLVIPGFLETKMTASLSETRIEAIKKDHCLENFNTPESVAAFVQTLHFDLTQTSGQVFNLDSRIV